MSYVPDSGVNPRCHQRLSASTDTLLAGVVGGCFLLLDQLLKFFIRLQPSHTWYLWRPWLGIEYFANRGVAFNIPIPNPILLFLTPLILFGLTLSLVRWNKSPSTGTTWAIALIISGAISNFLDRYLFGVTIDYIRIFTAVINLADILIVIGLLILLYQQKIKKTPSAIS